LRLIYAASELNMIDVFQQTERSNFIADFFGKLLTL